MEFADHFSGHAALYARYRPEYPAELYRWLAQQCPQHELAWDCATGNGQAARGLSPYFHRVLATDASEAQIAAAPATPNIRYLCASAGHSPAADASVDLITVAQALHWFELEAFYREVRRVLKPQGVIAAWSYNLLSIEGVNNELIREFYYGAIHAYWPAARIHVEQGYRELAFPFHTVQSLPSFSMQAEWTLEQLCGYLRSWSAVQKYIDATASDPLIELRQQLQQGWSEPGQSRTISWPLTLRVGRCQSD